MIYTLTANPSLDRTITVTSELTPGGVHRIDSDHTDPGGKGINVALGVARADLDVLAFFPAPDNDPLTALVSEAGLNCHVTPATGRVRTNLTVLSPPDVTTKINEPGHELTPQDVTAMESALISAISPGDHVMLSGSLAPGIPVDEYARLSRALKERGAWVGVDTSDAPLAALASAIVESGAGTAPDFLKPNAEELGQLTGRDGVALEDAARAGNVEAIREAAQALNAQGVAEILVTLGGSGAVLLTSEGAWYAPSPDAPVISTVGAGDSATAGYLIARTNGATPAERLALAVAYGAVAVSLPGTTIPSRHDVTPDVSTVRPI